MAAISITEIQLGADAVWKNVRFGKAASLGDAVYRGADQVWYPATATKTALEAGSNELGILLHGIDTDGQWGIVIVEGTIYMTISGTVGDGTTYIVGSTEGSIHPDADGASGWYKSILGVGGDAAFGGGTSDEFVINTFASGVQI